MDMGAHWLWHPAQIDGESVLTRARIEECKPVPSGSNYVFLLRIEDPDVGSGHAIYKPRKGEAPLWDFPDGTLYQRERAAYLVCRELGWDFIPPTVIRDGPYGIGAVQLFIPHNPQQNYFTLRDDHAAELRRIAVFDAITNNADRKGGHCLLGPDGRVWCIDHGLTFNEAHKLRTVIWDYSGEPIQLELIADLEAFSTRLRQREAIQQALQELLHPAEIEVFQRRIEQLVHKPVYPSPGFRRSVPWPPI
jgi:hypothetical protein